MRNSNLEPCGDGSRLLELRPITKSDFRHHYPAGVLASQPADDWGYMSTSGTTDRLTVVADFVKRDYRRCSELRGLEIACGESLGIETVEIPPNACNVVCGLEEAPRNLKQVLWEGLKSRSLFKKSSLADFRGRFEREIMLRKYTLPPLDPAPAEVLVPTLDVQLQIIRERNPRLLRGYPLYLLWLADRAKQTGVRFPRLSHILPYGGLASSRMITRIEEGFAASYRNVYGTSELGIIAAACGQSPGMHVFEDIFLVQAEPWSGASGRSARNLIMTDLINAVMPFVRYQVGDAGRLYEEPCPCGRKTARVDVLGRLQENLRIGNQVIPAGEIADTFFVDPNVANARLDEVAPGVFEAAIVRVPDASLPDVSAWEERFRQLAGSEIRRVRVKLVPYLRPETSGKYVFVWPFSR